MDTYSSGEDVILKVRKPYTITKQREKWTEEEHNKFLEALKLYGRAWQRIEEHIGTKTAVQIRSHAQKFFSKLEKEALTKGVPLGQAHGIEIPPPRPKRKPNNPYPRKTFVGVVPSSGEGKNEKPLISGSSLCSKKKVFELEMDTPHEDAPSAFTPPASNVPADACIVREFVPMVKENKDTEGDEECSPTLKGNKEPYNGNVDIGRFEGISIDTQMKLTQGTSTGMKQPVNVGTSLQKDSKGDKSYLKHIPDRQSNESVQTPGSGATCLTSLSNRGPKENPNLEKAPSLSATTDHHASTSMSSVHQSFAAFPPLTQFCSSQDAYRSFVNTSSTFSNLIMSTLLQNPALHSASSLAASFWPAADVESSTGSTSETFVGGIPVRHMNGSPSMAAIAAATVAAASAWWATHGILPFCHPAFHSGFTFAPASAGTTPKTQAAQATEDNKQRKNEITQSQMWMDPQQIVGPEPSAPGIQSSPLPSLDSDESGGDGRSQNIIQKGHVDKQVNPSPDSAAAESDMARSKKKLDRSSCGSNTPSSSEVETDTLLENIERGKEETEEVHLSHPPCGDTNNRRLRGGSNVTESWKEVSQEGRLAFQALFSREVLPQSFSPPHAQDGTVETAKNEKEAAALTLDLNRNVSSVTDIDHAQGFDKTPRASSSMDQGLPTYESGQVKLKSRRTGFKPYKRCSVEAWESRAPAVEEKDNKRIRLEAEAFL